MIYFCLGAPVLLAGALRIFAGVQNFRFRGRTLGIISMIAGMASMLTRVLIYGLIVYMNPAVAAAFAMGQQGATGSEILAAFMPYRSLPGQPPPWQPPSDLPPGGKM